MFSSDRSMVGPKLMSGTKHTFRQAIKSDNLKSERRHDDLYIGVDSRVTFLITQKCGVNEGSGQMAVRSPDIAMQCTH